MLAAKRLAFPHYLLPCIFTFKPALVPFKRRLLASSSGFFRLPNINSQNTPKPRQFPLQTPRAVHTAPLTRTRKTKSKMSSDTQSKRVADAPSNASAATKRARPNYSETIDVIVGKDGAEKRFTVYKSIICERSPFFKAACSRRWPEDREGVVPLPEHDPNAFEVILHWVYSKELDVTIMSQDGPFKSSNFGHIWSLAHYIQCFDLCNYLLDYKVQDSKELIQDLEKTALMNELFACFDTFPLGSNIRRFLIDGIATEANEGFYDKYFEKLPSDVVLALLKTYSCLSDQLKKKLKLKESKNYYMPETKV